MKPSEVLRTLGYMQNCVDIISENLEALKRRGPKQCKKEVDFITAIRSGAADLVGNCDNLLAAEK